MGYKINTANLMPGGEAWWLEQNKRNHPERFAAPNTDGSLSENELKESQNEEQEPNEPIKNFNEYSEKPKAEAQSIADKRADGEMNPVPPTVDRHDRNDVDESKADPQRVAELEEELGLSDGGTTATQETSAPTYAGYDDILKLMQHNAISDAEAARRQRSRDIVTGIGDTISAIANMWATTKGAPNSYDHSKGMSATAQARYEKMLAERKAQQEQILNYYRVKKAAEQERETQLYRQANLELRQQEAESKRAEREAKQDRDNRLASAREKALNAQAKYYETKDMKDKGDSDYWVAYIYATDVLGYDDTQAKTYAAIASKEAMDNYNAQKAAESKSKVDKNNRTGTGRSGGGRGGSGYTTTTEVEYVTDKDGNKVGERRTTTKSPGYTKPKRNNKGNNAGYKRPKK